jgi:hypothetical protein
MNEILLYIGKLLLQLSVSKYFVASYTRPKHAAYKILNKHTNSFMIHGIFLYFGLYASQREVQTNFEFKKLTIDLCVYVCGMEYLCSVYLL